MDVSMDTSMLLARLFGIVLLVSNVGFLLHRKFYHAVMKEFSQQHYTTYFSGVINLILGLLVVSFHNVWEDWRGLVTLLGWLLLLTGFFRLLYPRGCMKMAAKLSEAKHRHIATVMIVVFGLIGLYLVCCGFSSAQ